MRKIFMIFSMATVFAACSTKKTDLETSKDVVPTDTTGAYNNSLATDTATKSVAPVVPAVTPPPVTRTTPHVATRRQTAPKVVYLPAPTPKQTTVPAPTTAPTTAGAPTTGSAGTAGTGASTGTTTTTPQKTENKGWSNAAKGATIGGVGGAIGGAIISKKKGTGAIIGGVIGAAGGYIIGRKKDKANQAKQDTTK